MLCRALLAWTALPEGDDLSLALDGGYRARFHDGVIDQDRASA